jgi:hypothetical protein
MIRSIEIGNIISHASILQEHLVFKLAVVKTMHMLQRHVVKLLLYYYYYFTVINVPNSRFGMIYFDTEGQFRKCSFKLITTYVDVIIY